MLVSDGNQKEHWYIILKNLFTKEKFILEMTMDYGFQKSPSNGNDRYVN